MSAQPQRRLFTNGEYYKMLGSGILLEDDPVELIEGEVVRMSPVGSSHAALVKKLNRMLGRELGDRAIVSVQDPIRLDDLSEPEPDLAVLRPREDFYAEAHPGSEDVLLAIEVSDSSLSYDLEVKLPLYAGHAIAEVWVLDVRERVVEVYRDPDPSRRTYRRQLRREHGEALSPRAFPDLRLAVAAIFR